MYGNTYQAWFCCGNRAQGAREVCATQTPTQFQPRLRWNHNINQRLHPHLSLSKYNNGTQLGELLSVSLGQPQKRKPPGKKRAENEETNKNLCEWTYPQSQLITRGTWRLWCRESDRSNKGPSTQLNPDEITASPRATGLAERQEFGFTSKTKYLPPYPLSHTTTVQASNKKILQHKKGQGKTNSEETKQVSEPDSDIRQLLKTIQQFAPVDVHRTF